jgi:methionyl-tRNA formyltransferase
MRNVVFLGIDRPYSIEALSEVKKMECRVSASHLNKNKFKGFPNLYDLGISLGYLHKVPVEELKKAPWINFHPAPLPEYGGRNVAYHAILNKESNFGATIHYMNEEFDGGDIIEVRKFKFSLGVTAEELYNLACETSLDLLKEYIPKVLNGEGLTSVKQNNSTYYKKEPIDDFINIKDETKRMITALYCPPYYPKIKIGVKTFVIKEEK